MQKTGRKHWESERENERELRRQLMIRQRRREIRRRRRRNQIILRCLSFAVAVFALTLGIKGVVEGIRPHQEEAKPKQYAAQAKANSSMKLLSQGGEKSQEDAKPCIILDAGHGGKDPGTLWGDVYEKDINLAITKKLEQVLVEQGYQVVMTREEDERVVLKERVQIAQENRGTLFVSIHQNALENDTVTEGMEIYSSKMPDSQRLAENIWDSLLAKTGAKDKGITENSDLFVLDNTTMPACLIETGFITSSRERELLLDEEYQQKIAQGIAEGIIKFLES
ncbi:MAG: N-acetylmuramoyl-L-alanine amidase [Lachnospiraceae bacterium]|nr:N-acetylmuramoyl-L-alanine amidase [Lachnospiraceae bacterium]